MHPYTDMPLKVGVDFGEIGGMVEPMRCCKIMVEVPAVPILPLCRLTWVVTQAFGLHIDLT